SSACCTTRRASTPRSSARCWAWTKRSSGPAASTATPNWWCLRADVQGGAVERVQGALDGHRHARERGRVALGVGAGLGRAQALDEVEEDRRLVALERDHELLVVEPEGVARVEVDARVLAADADVLLHDPPALLRI